MACNRQFKSIYCLSLSPSFTILTNTLSKSMGKVSEFMIMFMIILGERSAVASLRVKPHCRRRLGSTRNEATVDGSSCGFIAC